MEILKIEPHEMPFLRLLAEKFPTVATASEEIINLQAILNLPKGTEHFLSDLHGEYASFQHVLRNASGVISSKIDQLFEMEMTATERKDLAFLIYYPKERLETMRETNVLMAEWYEVTLHRLVRLCRQTASKYTRSKVRKALPKEFRYIIEELLHEQENEKQGYYNRIIRTIIELDRADDFIIAISKLIQRFAIDHLHILGDIFDRGPGAHLIMELLTEYHSVDVQWGNHDILWMGAAAGSEACIANVLRIAFRYGNLHTLEDGYSINLRPLWNFAVKAYQGDPCAHFYPRQNDEKLSDSEKAQLAKLHKAISMIQFKLEGQIIKRRPLFDMDDRLLLEKIDWQNHTVTVDGKAYPLNDTFFPTISPKDPYALTEDEAQIMKKIKSAFLRSEKLQKHIRFLYAKGSLYRVHNQNLLFHGCILLTPDKQLKTLSIQGKEYTGQKLMDKFDKLARQGFFAKDAKVKQYGEDILWYLWSGADSPLFGKQKMATFERYFIDSKDARVEKKNPYYQFREDEAVCRMILEEFGLDADEGHIINGHVPVKAAKGESPVKANRKLIVIDGGLSKAYQAVTGIAGYTLIYNSRGLALIAHQPFVSKQKAIAEKIDIDSRLFILETLHHRLLVNDTDIGRELCEQIAALKKLLFAYRQGIIRER